MDVKFLSTTKSKLASLPIINGQIVALSDSDELYYDMGGVRRNAHTGNYIASKNGTHSGLLKLTVQTGWVPGDIDGINDQNTNLFLDAHDNNTYPSISFGYQGHRMAAIAFNDDESEMQFDFRYTEFEDAFVNVKANTFIGDLRGNSDTATKLTEAHNIGIKLNGTTKSASFDGSKDVTIDLGTISGENGSSSPLDIEMDFSPVMDEDDGTGAVLLLGTKATWDLTTDNAYVDITSESEFTLEDTTKLVALPIVVYSNSDGNVNSNSVLATGGLWDFVGHVYSKGGFHGKLIGNADTATKATKADRATVADALSYTDENNNTWTCSAEGLDNNLTKLFDFKTNVLDGTEPVGKAKQIETARTIGFSINGTTKSVSFDGSKNVSADFGTLAELEGKETLFEGSSTSVTIDGYNSSNDNKQLFDDYQRIEVFGYYTSGGGSYYMVKFDADFSQFRNSGITDSFYINTGENAALTFDAEYGTFHAVGANSAAITITKVIGYTY